MKKIKIIIIALIVVVLTGCKAYQINNLTYEKIVDLVLYDEVPKTNTALQGFKYYLPRDVRITSAKNNNEVLYSDGDKYYLYIDIIGYYNKSNNDYNLELTGNRIFTKEIEYQGKKGYVIITEQEDNYFLEVMHNYGKIELLTTKDKLKSSLAKSLVILASIDYNDSIIESLIGNDSLNYDEETYNLLTPNADKKSFLNYIEEYVDTDNEIPDEDVIKPEE